MKSNFSRCVSRLARFFQPQPVARPVARPRFRPILESLEDRALLSTLGVVNLGSGPGIEAGSSHALVAGSNSSQMTASASPAVSGPVVFHATDVPQPVDYLDVFTTSFIDIPQSLTLASLKVQLNMTYPLDNDLTIDLYAPNGTDVPLSSFEGTGANFQNTIFDDAATTPIWAGNSPFAGSYRPESPLAALAGMNAQGTWELQITDWGASSGTLNSWSLIALPAGSTAPAASSLTVSGFPSSTTAGKAGSFTVTARDANGNVDTGYTGTVHFTSSDPQAGLPADYTFTAADAGSHTFSAALKTAGTQSLSVTDTAASGLSGTEAGIAVSPAAASRLVVSAPAGSTTGTASSVTVTAYDPYGNVATGYTGTVHFTSSDGQAVLPANSTLSHGTGTFGVTWMTAGSQTLTVTDTANGTLAGKATVSVSPAASGALVFHSTDLPQALTPSEVFVSSVINVPQSVTIANVKVQVNITYPVDSNLRIDLFYIDNSGFLRKSLVLSDFVGNGANFQNTTFDDAASTPIAAGAPPFAGSYRPSDPLSALAGQNSQGTWVLEVGDFVGGSGTINSWSLIIQPAASPNAATGTAAQHGGTPSLVTASSPSLVPSGTVSPARLPMTGMSGQLAGGAAVMSASFSPSGLMAAGNAVIADQANALVAGTPAVSTVPRPAAFDPIQSASGAGSNPQALLDLTDVPAAKYPEAVGVESTLVRQDTGLDTPSEIHPRDGGLVDPDNVV
jgi:subtilisin-like proprotein convertase family protein